MKLWVDAIQSIKKYFTQWDKEGFRLIIYGDLNGCLGELMKLREKVIPQEDDIEVCVGDLINKGPDSKELLKYLRKNGIFSVRGNHEDKIVRYREHKIRGDKPNPVILTPKQEELAKELDKKNWEYLENLPYFLRFDNIVVLHGGTTPDIALESASKDDLHKVIHLRFLDEEGNFLSLDAPKSKRACFWSEKYDGKEGFIVYGHQVYDKPKYENYTLGIDTGCVYGGSLSCAIFEKTKAGFDIDNYKIEKVNSRKKYAAKS